MTRTTQTLKLEGNEMLISFLISLLLCFLIMFIPPYDRVIYSSTEPVNERAYGLTGYPAGEGIPVAENRTQVKKAQAAFTLEADAEQVEALDIYKGIGNYKISVSSFERLISKWLNETTMGRYYLVTLDSGARIFVFVDDLAFKIPTSGKVRFPIGNQVEMSPEIKSYLYGYTQNYYYERNSKILVDMASDWRCKSKEAKLIPVIRWTTGILTLLVTWAFTYFRLKNRTKKNKEKTKKK